MHTGKLLGRDLYTDNYDLLKAIDLEITGERYAIGRMFPGFSIALVQSLQLMESKRLSAETITYFNFRLQVWAREGFDADPTPPVRIVPAGAVMDPNGPTSFAP